MKVLIATNYFKGSLSALEAAECIQRGIQKVDNQIQTEIIPIADGGDGTIEAIKNCTDCKEMLSIVNGPLKHETTAQWLIIQNNKKEKIAIIEGAQANGLSLLSYDEYNPLLTTTYGIGQLILNALEHKCNKIIVTIGGSSTNDGGAGIIQALGGLLLDDEDKPVARGGGPLENLERIDLSKIDKRLKKVKFIVACDVDNPLCGANGASYVYGPQKGANPEQVYMLDKNLCKFADLTEKIIGKDFRDFPGAGAAGGIGFTMKAFLNAEMIPGFDLVAELSDMEKKLKECKLAITTEGRLDSQSLSGKAPYQVAMLAKKYNIPTIAIAGSIEKGLDLKKANITSAFSIVDGPQELSEAIKNADYLLENITIQIFNLLKTKIL